jgi:O-antigen/teichoic acid export membrane protein
MRPRRQNAHMSDADTLRDKVARGAFWSILTQISIQATRLLVGIVLARLLTPHEFGVAGMALVLSNLLTLFTDLSLGAALIQRPSITESDRSTMFWTTLAVGLLCTGFGIAISGPVGDFFHQPQAGSLFAVLSVGFTLSALSSTQSALATRELAYRRLQTREMAAIGISAVVAVVVAAIGGGAWAIIAQQLTFGAASAVLIWLLSPWRPRLVFSSASFRSLGSFGITLFGSRLLAYANLNADNLLIGRFLGGQALGIYSLAYNVMFTPMLRIGLPFQQVVFPAYARLQSDPGRLGLAWVRSRRLAAAVLAPLFLAILVVAPDLVPVVFGAKWHRAIGVVQLLCVAGVAHTLVTLNWSVLQALGMARLLFTINLFTSAVIVGGFAIGLTWGIVGVAAAYAIAKWLLILPDVWLTSRAVAMGAFQSLRQSCVSLPLACLAAGFAYGVRMALVATAVPAGARLVVVLACGLVAYVGLLALAAPAIIQEVLGLRGSLIGRRVGSPAKSVA